MVQKKPPRGRPKVPWEHFHNELDRRLKSGEALETVQAEAKYLAEWVVKEGLVAKGEIGFERIRERIKKRLNGSQGYKNTRMHHRLLLGLD